MAAPASAGIGAQCNKYTAPTPYPVGGVTTRVVTLAGCTGLTAGSVSGKSLISLKTHIGVTTWAKGLGTTVVAVDYKPGPTTNNCAAGTRSTITGGTVTGGSGAALGVIKVGSTVSARLCVTDTSAVSLEPGTAYRFTNKAAMESAPPPPSGNSPPAPVPLSAGLSACPANATTAMIALVNRDRRVTGNRPPLTENANLDWAARKHSIVMATSSVMSHNGWDTEIAASHYVVGAPGWTGQNIAWMTGGFSPATIESMFFNEVAPNDGHRQNILNTNFHNIGISCIVNKKTGAYWWTQDFGS